MKIDGVLFDLDGTLWNSIRSILPSWQRLGRERAGVEITADMLASIMGKRHQEIGDLFFPNIPDPKARLELTLECCDAECVGLDVTGGELYPGVDETLRALANEYPLAVISNCGTGYIEAFLKAHRFSDCFVDFENTTTGLSKGENIRLVMERQGIRRAVYVGDTQGDADAAKFAGIPFIFASYGFGTVKAEDITATLTGLSQLPAVLHNL